MVGVAASADSKSIVILGHGLAITEEFELSTGIVVSPAIPKLDLQATVAGCNHFGDYAAALHPNLIGLRLQPTLREIKGGHYGGQGAIMATKPLQNNGFWRAAPDPDEHYVYAIPL
ncbi:hypothetical protein [Sphingomonas sp. 2378]|uniref:hypothetical protein n=1 Tax=Sphingomonas sp. 2378 TaxID=1219748 RepID=UPI00311B2516